MKLLAYPIHIDSRRNVKIVTVTSETPTIKSFTFSDKRCRRAHPGQYVMVWIPGVDEIPLSLSSINHLGLSRITVKRVGEATEALHKMGVGDLIGIRGPFGNWFTTTYGQVLIVGGGIGIAPLIPLIEELDGLEAKVVFVLGATKKEELLLHREVKTILNAKRNRITSTTEDGSYGLKGLATDTLEGIFEKDGFDLVYTCGPELMMRQVFEVAEGYGVPVQMCFERIVRCSVGMCGSCVIGGIRICKEGPILSSEQLRTLFDELGKFKRDLKGVRLHFD